MDFTSKTKILVLYASTYEIEDESSKDVNRGCTVHYMFFGENGEQFLTHSEYDVTKPVGMQRAKCSVDYDIRKKLVLAPAIYEGEFEMKIGSDGKPILKLVDVAYVSNVEIKEKSVPGLVVPGMVEKKEK